MHLLPFLPDQMGESISMEEREVRPGSDSKLQHLTLRRTD